MSEEKKLERCKDPDCPLIPSHTVNVCAEAIADMGFKVSEEKECLYDSENQAPGLQEEK